MKAPAFLLLAGLALTGRLAGADAVPTAAQLEFFEKEVRPILAENCYECHGPKKQKSGLRLDARAYILKGGEVGPVVVPGQPEQSRLILAINHTKRKDVEAMPSEDKKLAPKEIAALTEWVRQGLPWPTSGQPEIADPRKHWAFQPITAPTLPKVAAAERVRNDVDRHLLAKLEAVGLTYAPEASKETLIRRAYFTLHGLPPSAEDIERFVADRDPQAYEQLVDRLLAAPAFGERWGRHWLDVARYADTKGYVFEEERRYAYAYTYRDWVVGAFNQDMPYDRFLKLQLAADALVTGEDTRDLAALGFLTLGRRFLNNQQDIIDDRIDVVMRGTQGLTMACARCHDHKSDPLPSTDYYALYAIFNSSEEPKDKPLLKPFTPTKDSQEFEAELATKEAKVVEFRTSRREGSFSAAKTTAYLGVLRRSLADAKFDDAQEAKRLALYPAILAGWKKTLKPRLVATDPLFGLWARLAGTTDDAFKAKLSAELLAKSATPLDGALQAALTKKLPTKFDELLAVYGELLATARGNPTLELKPWRELIEAPNGPTAPTADSLVGSYVVADAQKHRALIREVEAFKASPKSPPRAMAIVDKAQPVNGTVFLRGNPGRPGKNVTRHYLSILTPNGQPTDFKRGSGRLELAEAIASANNPLTARVMVNRVWDQVFGQPLVETPSDFGVRTAPPTNPALLDGLATRFIADQWSMKRLIRTLVTSAAFRQSSETHKAGLAKDPENRLLWRMNRRRADFETMRDSILAVSGRLEPKLGGQPFDLVANFGTPRRTLYALIDRQNLPAVFRTFDFANPDYHVARRNQTTTPQQALWMLNHPFTRQQADLLADKLAGAKSDEAKVAQLYRTILGRAPQASEVKQALVYVQAVRQAPAPASWLSGVGGYDPAKKQVTFTEMKVLKKDTLTPTETYPDTTSGNGHAALTAKGGHPGNDAQHAVIRRWAAGGGGEFRIDGELKVASAHSQGVRARIVSAQRGLLGEWTCLGGAAVQVALPKAVIAPGDTVDFILDDLNGPNSDGFSWSPVIKDARTGEVIDAAAAGFNRKSSPQSPWSSLAQVLFASNEFNFAE
jgi:mono/diheme cytochrome c family protein